MNKQTNANAPVKCSKSITINAPVQKVWNVLTNINDWASWQTDIDDPKVNDKPEPGVSFTWKTGGAKIHSTIHTADFGKVFGWTGKTMGMFAIHNWTLTEKDGITTVSVDESMQGFLAALLKKSFNKNLARDMQHWLELLKTKCEK